MEKPLYSSVEKHSLSTYTHWPYYWISLYAVTLGDPRKKKQAIFLHICMLYNEYIQFLHKGLRILNQGPCIPLQLSSGVGGGGESGFAQPIGLCVSLLCIDFWVPRFSSHSISTSMSVSTEINHTSPPSLELSPSQGSLLPYTRSVVYLGLGQRKSSVLGEPWQQHFNRVQWCCASLQSKLNRNSISDRSVRRTSSRLVIILPAGIWTYHHCWWMLVGDFSRLQAGSTFHPTACTKPPPQSLSVILQCLWTQKADYCFLRCQELLLQLLGFPEMLPPRYWLSQVLQLKRFSFSKFFFSTDAHSTEGIH